MWLKSLGNTGLYSPTVVHTLNSIIINTDLTVDIRISGVQAYRYVESIGNYSYNHFRKK